jgi:glycosyltransferase involved in cell wall biosynthesis
VQGRPLRRDGLRVLVTVDSLRDNGGLRVALEYARRWQALGAQQGGVSAAVCAVQDVTDGALATPPAEVPLGFATARGSRFRYTWPLAVARLVRRARRADVVLAGSETGIGLLLGFLAARVARRPFAVLVQADVDDAVATWVPRVLQPLTRLVLRRADAAVCVADSIVPGIVANGLPAERVSVVVNGIDVTAVRMRAGLPARGDVPAPASPQDGPPVVVAVGRLSVQKDFPLLVRAHARVREAGVDHRLLVIGEGPERPTVERTIAELGVAGSVDLPGHMEEPHRHTAGADLFVLSSRTEGSPLAVLEALSVGAPIVATRCGTGVELLLDGGTYGELVESGSVDALADAIARHLRDPAPLRARAKDGPDRARSFDVSLSARRVLTVLAGLAGARQVVDRVRVP